MSGFDAEPIRMENPKSFLAPKGRKIIASGR